MWCSQKLTVISFSTRQSIAAGCVKLYTAVQLLTKVLRKTEKVSHSILRVLKLHFRPSVNSYYKRVTFRQEQKQKLFSSPIVSLM